MCMGRAGWIVAALLLALSWPAAGHHAQANQISQASQQAQASRPAPQPAPQPAPRVRIRAAVIEEQGIAFAVVYVSGPVLEDAAAAVRAQARYARFFLLPVVLMTDDAKGPRWFGREDIVRFLSAYAFEDIPWEVHELPE